MIRVFLFLNLAPPEIIIETFIVLFKAFWTFYRLKSDATKFKPFLRTSETL